MKIARVVGTVVSTIHHPSVNGRRLLLCDLLDEHGKPTGDYNIAMDAVNAGAGEIVLLLDEGSSARQILGDSKAPIRSVVAGIVDQLVVDGELIADASGIVGR